MFKILYSNDAPEKHESKKLRQFARNQDAKEFMASYPGQAIL